MITKKQAQEFFKRLEGPEGCDFRDDEKKGCIWKCAGGQDQSLSQELLKTMGVDEEDSKEFLQVCSEKGGHCDCEIIFNAAAPVLSDWPWRPGRGRWRARK